MITDWTSMYPNGSNEYWPELQQAIDDWEQRIHDGRSTLSMLVWALLQAEHRAETAEMKLNIILPVYIVHCAKLLEDVDTLRHRVAADEITINSARSKIRRLEERLGIYSSGGEQP
jgi:hypothetical protein